MKKISQKSKDLCEMMMKKGFPKEFCILVSQECNTEFTAKKMMGYLYQAKHISMESVVDEMLAILSLRDRIVEKKIKENNQAALNNRKY